MSLEQAIVSSIEHADRDLTVAELSAELDVEEQLVQEALDDSKRSWVLKIRRPIHKGSPYEATVIGYVPYELYLKHKNRNLKLRYETKKRCTRSKIKKLRYKLDYLVNKFLL